MPAQPSPATEVEGDVEGDPILLLLPEGALVADGLPTVTVSTGYELEASQTLAVRLAACE